MEDDQDMKKSMSPILVWIIAIVTVVVLVFNPIPRLIYGALGWSITTQVIFFIAIMLLLAVLSVLFDRREESRKKGNADCNVDQNGSGTETDGG